jgi:hypothetical protein
MLMVSKAEPMTVVASFIKKAFWFSMRVDSFRVWASAIICLEIWIVLSALDRVWVLLFVLWAFSAWDRKVEAMFS